jgi:hypothetical protein
MLSYLKEVPRSVLPFLYNLLCVAGVVLTSAYVDIFVRLGTTIDVPSLIVSSLTLTNLRWGLFSALGCSLFRGDL